MGGSFGSDGFWTFLGIMIILGIISGLYLGFQAVIWVFDHIRII